MKLNIFEPGNEWKVLVLIPILFICVFSIVNAIVIIGPGERGVLLEAGRVTGIVFDEGFHLKFPFIQSVDGIDVKTLKVESEASAASKDLQIVTSLIALNYRVLPESVAWLRQNIGLDYKSKIIDPAIQEAVKSATAQFTAEELITKRSLVREQMKLQLQEKLTSLSSGSIKVEDFNIIDFQFSSEFDTAIELKVTAEQLALKARRDLERIKTEAEQKIATAEAEAEAIIVQAKALANSTSILSLRWIEKWNGQLPIYMGGGEGIIISLPQSQ